MLCDDCQHKEVCSYKKDYQKLNDSMKRADIDKTIFQIDLKCYKYMELRKNAIPYDDKLLNDWIQNNWLQKY